jgi:RHS repeat-associated protein
MALSKTDYQQQADVYKAIHYAGINDANQLRNYTRQFNYDDAGNLVQMKHIGENAFTRDFLISGISNRSISDEMDTTVEVDAYFDAAGNMNQLEHLQRIEWNYRNNIASITIVERATGNDTEYYVYDAAGQRTRKIKETYNSTGTLLYKEEKIYLGNVEIKRRYQGTTETLLEDRSALHIMDDKKRIAIAYYWATSNDSSVSIGENKMHYQLGNHLGSAAIELDEEGLIISYEEYFPFGETAFTTGSNATEVALKEYRFSGKERDDGTALYYYGARYYASWMGRWLNPDPAGTVDGLNLYLFVANNPLNWIDPEGLDKCSPGEFKGFIHEQGQYFETFASDENVCLPSPMIIATGDTSELVYPGEESKIAPGSLLLNPLEDPLKNDDVKTTIDQMDTDIGWMELGAKGFFPIAHPWKTWQHVGPKYMMGGYLHESEDLIAAYPNLLAEIGSFYAETGTTPIVEVIAGLRVVDPANKERLYRNFVFRKEMTEPIAADLPVIENMFGDPRQTTGYNEFYWGNFSIVGKEVNVVQGPDAPAHQYKLTVTDSLGLQGNEPAPLVWLYDLGIIGGSNIILGEIYVGIDANGTAQILPWSTVSPPVYGYPEKGTMAPVRLPGR